MDNIVLGQIKDFIGKNNRIGIAVGKNPAVDEMGGAAALYLSLSSSGKDVTIVCPTEALVEHSHLVGIDKVKSSFEGGAGDMVVSFPYKEGEIEKISYTLEDGFLNIIVKAGEEGLNFSENDVLFKRSQGYPGLLFVIGAPRLSDLGRIFDPQALKDTVVINIDNKSDNQGFGDIALVSPNNSSICERIGDLILSLDLPLDIDTAQNLLIGIENATENFQNTKTSPLAFEMAGELMRKGAVRSDNSSSKTQVKEDEEESSIFSQKNIPKPRIDKKDQVRPGPASPASTRFAEDPARRARGVQAGEQTPLRQGSAGQGKNPPVDWLAPKIYKGSTNI